MRECGSQERKCLCIYQRRAMTTNSVKALPPFFSLLVFLFSSFLSIGTSQYFTVQQPLSDLIVGAQYLVTFYGRRDPRFGSSFSPQYGVGSGLQDNSNIGSGPTLTSDNDVNWVTFTYTFTAQTVSDYFFVRLVTQGYYYGTAIQIDNFSIVQV
jgi:hypothetical protein